MMTKILTLVGKTIQDVSVAKIGSNIVSLCFLFDDGERLQIDPFNYKETLVVTEISGRVEQQNNL